jgi:hypothetical protein
MELAAKSKMTQRNLMRNRTLVMQKDGGKRIKTPRLSAEAEALLEEARKNSASLAAFADGEYGSLGTTTEEIFRLDDRKIMGALNYRIGRKLRKRITEMERRLLAVYWLEGEVCNGGFHQYFFNSASDDSDAALAGLCGRR